ncbi:LacI family transcriptional regulator [Diaminobutyricibacter tongyongensis]|uniref:LacI family transcriptional regulator n=1 Tax=Leifsonia tongyongensis TaxID=1268043 RepID=A0A6L9XX61_9MICO|nr:LacI family DNA-binding transcriptional regulator [Diaminobutyricibacter tongyongensis]NEN05644.1 LacI family transcriptional regulator [Diaminobutyricibacter tongyongensis]
MKDVAALAGVGIKTVSRVINREPNVSSATIERVQSAADRLNYQPDIHAGNLRRSDRRTQTLGLLVGSVANPFSGAVHRAIEDAATARGVAVFASSLDDDPARERLAVTAFLKRRVDGLILTAVSKSQGYLLPEQERGTPIVFIDREPSGIDADAIVSNNAEGAALATRHLLERGHRRIAFLGDRHEIQTAVERRRGFLEELGRAGIPTGEAWVIEDLHDEHAAHAAVADILAGDSRPTAIFSAQNLITMGAIRGLRDRNLQSSVALVGFDDVEFGDLLDPGITVIAQDPDRIGHLAAERIFARLDGEDVPVEIVVVPTTLIERGSGEIAPTE